MYLWWLDWIQAKLTWFCVAMNVLLGSINTVVSGPFSGKNMCILHIGGICFLNFTWTLRMNSSNQTSVEVKTAQCGRITLLHAIIFAEVVEALKLFANFTTTAKRDWSSCNFTEQNWVKVECTFVSSSTSMTGIDLLTHQVVYSWK